MPSPRFPKTDRDRSLGPLSEKVTVHWNPGDNTSITYLFILAKLLT